MQKSGIEWTNYTINPVKGLCPVACKDNQGKEYCYARRMYDRFKWNPRLRYDPSAWLGLGSLRKPSRIFVGSTMELFHNCINPQWLKWIFEVPLEFPQHTFIFLTKCPGNLIKWSPFPDNCWVGVSATNAKMAEEAGFWLWEVKAKVKFISFEPLLECIPLHFADYISEDVQGINWVIIGAQTKPFKPPKLGWVEEIVKSADRANIPIFLKNNLWPLFNGSQHPVPIGWCWDKDSHLRQEMPKEK